MWVPKLHRDLIAKNGRGSVFYDLSTLTNFRTPAHNNNMQFVDDRLLSPKQCMFFLNMNKQFLWLSELLNKKPKEHYEYFYIDIQHYFGLNLEPKDFKDDMRTLFRICGSYAEELFICTSKVEVKKWLDDIALDITHNLEVDYIIENYICYKRGNKEEEAKQPE